MAESSQNTDFPGETDESLLRSFDTFPTAL
jgi:hypothetical protein